MKTKFYKLLLLSALFIAAFTTSMKAQVIQQCGTDEMMRKLYAAHPELVQQQIAYDNALATIISNNYQEKSIEGIYYVPVVFHIIYASDAQGNLSGENLADNVIYNAVDTINKDWMMLNWDTSLIVGFNPNNFAPGNHPYDTVRAANKIQFRLARLDPNGNCTNGIEHIYSHLTYNAGDGSKLNQWDRSKYLNIWIVNNFRPDPSGFQAAAYAYFPSAMAGFGYQADGVICLFDYAGNAGAPNHSRTLTHEIGHVFNLEHPWGNNNSADVACGDDGVDDTPKTRGHLGCGTADQSPHCTVAHNHSQTFGFTSVTPISGVTDTSAVPNIHDDTTNLTHFTAVGVSNNSIDSMRFGFTKWGTGSITGIAISMAVADSGGTGYNIGDTFNPIGGTATTPTVGTVTATQISSQVLISPGTSGYIPAQILTLGTTGTGTQPTAIVVTTKVVGTPIMTIAGSAYTANDTLTLATGAGTKATIIVDAVNSGAILTFHLATAGAYTTNPTLTADAVTGGTGTGAKFTIKMGINTYTFNGGSFTANPILDTVTATGGGTGASWSLLAIGAKTLTFTSGAGYVVNPATFPKDTVEATTNVTGTGTGLTITLGLGPVTSGTIDTTQYYQVTLTPTFGHSITFTGINFNVKRNSTGVRSFAVRSSSNNYVSNLTATIAPANAGLSIQGANEFFYNMDTTLIENGCHITLSGANYTNQLNPTTFRFYAWNAEDINGSFSIDNVQFIDTAGVVENFDNFMDYSYCNPEGQRMFTKGQKARVRAAAESSVSYRNHLWLASNDTATGIMPYPAIPAVKCVPTPAFIANRRVICAGNNVTFTPLISNISLPATVANTYRRWIFAGGTPSGLTTLTNTSPTVTYNTPGDYDVTLIDSIAGGSNIVTKTAMVRVMPTWAQYNGIAQENFENAASYYWNWTIDDYDNNGHSWSLVNFTGYSGNHCMAMGGYGNYHDDIDDFITPGYNLYGVTGGTLTFRCAGASTATTPLDDSDVLQVFYSKDCGTSWHPLGGTITGSALSNNGFVSSAWAPTMQSQWALHSIVIPSNIAVGNVRFKFQYTTGFASNNIFIDDININGTLGIAENTIDDATLSIYPNPTNDVSNIKYHLNVKGNVTIELFDVVGKKVVEINNNNQAEGDYVTSISKQDHNLQDGIYFIRFIVDNKAITKKIVFTE